MFKRFIEKIKALTIKRKADENRLYSLGCSCCPIYKKELPECPCRRNCLVHFLGNQSNPMPDDYNPIFYRLVKMQPWH